MHSLLDAVLHLVNCSSASCQQYDGYSTSRLTSLIAQQYLTSKLAVQVQTTPNDNRVIGGYTIEQAVVERSYGQRHIKHGPSEIVWIIC